MEAYFDNSATTRCFEEVKDIVVKTMMEDFGNPSAMHQKGVDAEGYVKESARTLAQILKVTEKEILFTSGGTESNNLALIGGALANKRSGNHIVTTAVEHAAVSQPVAFLQEQGFEVTILPVDGHGVVKLDALEKALRPDTILVSTMMVNNETGAVMPVEKIGAMIQEKCPKVRRNGISIFCLSAHIRSMDQKELDSCTSTARQKCSLSFSAAASRTACVPEQTTYRESQDLALQQR